MKNVYLNIKINEELKNKSKSIAAGKGQDLKDYTAEALQEKNEKEKGE